MAYGGLRNLGASCFLNSGIQALASVPGFATAIHEGADPVEQALSKVFDTMMAEGTCTPLPMTDLFYHNRQEDSAEFVVNVLASCTSSRKLFEGKEEPRFRCQHCDYSRPLAVDPFITLQLPLLAPHPLRSVQAAIDSYITAEHVQENVEDWCCLNSDCLEAGRAEDAPMHQTRVVSWPDRLVLCLKRWDVHHGLLRHDVRCEKMIAVHGHAYMLDSIIVHLGAEACSGHYIAYRRSQDGFARMNDSHQEQVQCPGESFACKPEEKVYMVMYSKLAAAPRGTKRPAINLDDDSTPNAFMDQNASTALETNNSDPEPDTDSDVVMVHSIHRPDHAESHNDERNIRPPAIDLDEDTEATDSDVVMVQDAHEPEPDPASEAASPKRLKTFRNFTPAEREQIAHILASTKTFEDALKQLATEVVRLTTKDTTSPTHMSRRLLKSWHTDPGKATKAVASCNRNDVSCKNTSPEAPRQSGAHNVDRMTAGTARARLAADERKTVANALQISKTTQDLVQALSQSLPGFSSTDRNARHFIPRSTLGYWLGKKNWFANQPFEDAPANWESEQKLEFAVAGELPACRSLPVLAESDLNGLWLQNGSWTFCPRCGRHRARSAKFPLAANHSPVVPCHPACDPDALLLLAPPQQNLTVVNKLQGYITPALKHWQSWTEYIAGGQLPLTRILPKEELHNLAVVDIKIDFRSRRGGSAEVTSKQKRTVVRCRWRSTSLMTLQRGDVAARTFQWLLDNNSTYAGYVVRHHQMTINQKKAPDWREIPTAELLLNSPGIEVAARPWLYPVASYGDSDISQRLQSLRWTSGSQKPSVRAAFLRKLLSRCVDYKQDFALHCLLYDIVMAKTISSVLNIAIQKNATPERICSDMDTFEGYWLQQLRKMEDICRQEYEKSEDMVKALPNVFFTVAPAEWKYLLPKGLFHEDSLSNQQLLLTLHLHNTLAGLLEAHILKDGFSLAQIGLARVRQWSMRFEFQARGTLHVHVVLWADLQENWAPEHLNGRSNTDKTSAFLRLLEETFKCRADVQCGDGSHVLLKYVAGYLAKASDALQFQAKQARAEGEQASHWRQTYRLLSKRSPMEQEITMEFAGLAMVKHSFSGIEMFAPQPGSKAQNFARHHYDVYQHYMKQPADVFGAAQDMNFIQWLRKFRLASSDPKEYKILARNQAGPAAGKACGVAMAFPFELLDLFIGAWACTCMPNMLEVRLAPDTPTADMYPAGHHQEWLRRRSFQAPDGCRCLKTVLCLDEFQADNSVPETFNPDVGKLLSMIEPELNFRGIGQDRISTFKARLHACTLLLKKVARQEEDPAVWSARRPASSPARQWSSQQLEVLERIQQGLNISDAAEQVGQRVLQVSGGPGTGKTEVIIEATRRALEDDCRVLIVGPIGLLVSMYRPALHA